MAFKNSTLIKGIRTVFGVFMIFVYLGMAILLMINFFEWSVTMAWARWSLAILFAVYGLWRGYRQFTGMDYYIGSNVSDEEEEDLK